ncbi:MAG: DUF6179 domain-containing protein [Clostridiales bacterium]|jgi:hypothetical protein|nr:DUF6179 domain-containing protein [Clostridiales bacterium]
MSNSLDSIRVIKRSDLSETDYLQTLIEQALHKGLISDKETERIQLECLTLLADKVNRYNMGDSSSIPVDKAKDIMNSLFFTISLWLKTYENPCDAVVILQKEPVKDIYQKGLRRINTLLASTKTVHGILLKELVPTPNVYYSATLKDGILGFFKLYYPEFSAQEIHITADYPLYNPIPKLSGIEFIKAYTQAAYYENKFCAYFDPSNIHYLLCGFDRNYNELLFNIYEHVLTAAIGCAALNKDTCNLDIGESGINQLYTLFLGMEENIPEILRQAFRTLDGLFTFSDGLKAYIKKSLSTVYRAILHNTRNRSLDRIFFTPKYPEQKQKIMFSFGEKMDDELYRKVVDEIRKYRFTQDKLSIINEFVHSLTDLEDIISDALLSKEEVQMILKRLELSEIAALLNKYKHVGELAINELDEKEAFLIENIRQYVVALTEAQQETVKNIMSAMAE